MLGHQGDIILGSIRPPWPWPKAQLRGREQDVHATIWGRTGSGKSKLLQSVFLQHVALGNGVGLIEPHHDLSYDCLASLVADGFFRDGKGYDRLVYLDWGGEGYVPFNVLRGRDDPHTTALNVLEAMTRVWPELTEAPMFQMLFLSSVVVLIKNELPITYIFRLLSEPKFKTECLKQVDDPAVVQSLSFYDRLGKDQAALAGSTLRRAFLLLFSPLMRLSLGQPDNWLDLREVMDSRKGLIINLGNIRDQDTKRLLGALLLVTLEQAAMSRTDQAPHERTPFTMMLDEWPSFAAQAGTLGAILSQCRKFGLRLWLAAQSIAQLDSDRLTGAVENCRLTVAFGLGRDSAENQAKHLGKADPRQVKTEAHTPVQHPQFFSLPEQWEGWVQDLQHLKPQEAFMKLSDRPTVKFRTDTLTQPKVDGGEMKEVLSEYRHRWTRSQGEAQERIKLITDRWGEASMGGGTVSDRVGLNQADWEAQEVGLSDAA